MIVSSIFASNFFWFNSCLSRSKNQCFGRNSRSGLLIWFTLPIKIDSYPICNKLSNLGFYFDRKSTSIVGWGRHLALLPIIARAWLALQSSSGNCKPFTEKDIKTPKYTIKYSTLEGLGMSKTDQQSLNGSSLMSW